MAVKILQRTYNEIFTDGQTDWLLGNVGEWQKVLTTVEVGIDFIGSQQKPLTVDTINNAFILASGGSWGALGFDTGMTATFQYKLEEDNDTDGVFEIVTSFQKNYTITNVYGSTLEVEEEIETSGFETIPTNFGTKRVSEVFMYVDQDPEGCRLGFTHLTNDNFQSSELKSFIDNSTTEFIFPQLNNLATGSFVELEPIGLQSGMSVKRARVRKLENTDSEIYASLNISNDNPPNLAILDSNGSDPDYDSARPFRCTVVNPGANIFPVSTTSLVPQDNQGNGVLRQGVFEQAFLRNYPEEASFALSINVDFRITGSDNDNRQDENEIQLVLARYVGGSQMNIQEEIVLRQWENADSLINTNLNFNGIVDVDVDPGGSLVLLVRWLHDRPFNNDNFGVAYAVTQGSIQVSQPNGDFNSNYKRVYDFEIEYLISSFFDSINNFIDGEPPSFLLGDGSLTDNFKFEFYPEWNNPNVYILNDLTQTARLGNTGWFDENFNQLNNDFQVDSVEYFDENGNPVPSLDYAVETKVKAIISGVPNLNTNTECGFGFIWVPIDEIDYQEKETPFYRNTYIQNGDNQNGFNLDTLYSGTFPGAGINGGSIDTKNVKFTKSGEKIIFEATFVPNAGFFTAFEARSENDRNYVLWVSVADGSLSRNFSDRVSLLADFNSLLKNIPPAGAYEEISNSFLEHPLLEDATGEERIQAIVQDDILCRLPFRIPNDGSLVFNQMTFGVEVFNLGLNRKFDLQRFEVDLSQFPTDANGVQQFNVDTTRGFKLNQGNNKNWVKIFRETGIDSPILSGFIAFFAFKIRWEDWIQNSETPGDFFDATLLNEGLNNDWVHYLRTQGWEVNFFTEIVASESGELKLFRNSFNFTFVDYDENENVQTAHRYFRHSDDTLINVGTDAETLRPLGVILSNELTRVEIDFEILDEGAWDLAGTYGVMTLEVDKGAGQLEQRQLSSVWDSESDNPLIPVENEQRLKLEVDGTSKTLTMKALIDPELLEDALRYRITGRVGCRDADGGFSAGLYETKYETIYE